MSLSDTVSVPGKTRAAFYDEAIRLYSQPMPGHPLISKELFLQHRTPYEICGGALGPQDLDPELLDIYTHVYGLSDQTARVALRLFSDGMGYDDAIEAASLLMPAREDA